MKKQVRRTRLSSPGHEKKTPGKAVKRNWFSRHPLLSGAVLAAGIGAAAIFSGKNEAGEEKGSQKEAKSPCENAKEKKERRIRETLARIEHIVAFQKKIMDGGWKKRWREQEKERRQMGEEEFRGALFGKTKQELTEMLVAQNRIIGELREESAGGDEIWHERNKQMIIQRMLDDMEIAERGLLKKSIDELESLLSELDEAIIEGEENIRNLDGYLQAMEERALVAKALEEKRVWGEIIYPSTIWKEARD
ncbi:hypothetical protein GF415_02120 [Candidatus Micrarchaeota archaeon]|nr:hypothetical protein [Candidatus Micrarchaeota archaeon]